MPPLMLRSWGAATPLKSGPMRPKDVKYSNLPLGVSLAMAEVMLLLVIAGLVKLTAADVSVITALVARYLFCLPILLIVGIRVHGANAITVARPRPLAIRILVGLLGLGFYFAALDHIAFAKVTAIGQTATLFVTLLAPFLLAETDRVAAVVGLYSGVCRER